MDARYFRETLKKKGHGITQARLWIYRELTDAHGPVTPKGLYGNLLRRRGLKKVSLNSVCLSLKLFESLSLVFKIKNGPETKYQLCKIERHHHHIACKKCGNVAEVSFCNIADWMKEVKESTGYKVVDHQFNFYGICGACVKDIDQTESMVNYDKNWT